MVKIGMKLNSFQLENIIIAILNNANNKKFIGNVTSLFNMFSPESYFNDSDKEVRVFLIKKILDIINKEGISEKASLLSLIDLDGRFVNECTEILNNVSNLVLPENDMISLDKKISSLLRYAAIERTADNLLDQLTNFKTENYDDLDDQISQINSTVEHINKQLRDARESIEDAKKNISLSDAGFANVVNNIIQKERNPSTKIKTGIQFLNTMLNGGWEKGRVYCALGVAKGFKSGFMLNALCAAKRFNSIATKDPKKKPVIVYLTMENSIEETVTRIWNYAMGDDDSISNHEPNDVMAALEAQKIFTPNDPDSPEIVIWYRSNRSINTNDLIGLLDELEKDGKECVFLILDYLKRIRSTSPNKELRFELGQITDELAAMAKERDIPILTAMQLNREAFKALEDAENIDKKIAASDKLGASNIGESIDIIQNADYAFIVNRMETLQRNDNGDIESNDRYLFVKLIACRGKQPKITSFTHRFKENNGMHLIDDVNLRIPQSANTDDALVRMRMENGNVKITGPRKIIGNK